MRFCTCTRFYFVPFHSFVVSYSSTLVSVSPPSSLIILGIYFKLSTLESKSCVYWMCCFSPLVVHWELSSRAEGVAQLVESLPSMQEAMGSIPSIEQTRLGSTSSKSGVQSHNTLLSSRSARDTWEPASRNWSLSSARHLVHNYDPSTP